MAGVSDFRRKKLMHVFNVIFDFNHSGTIEEKDFELAVEKITRMRNWDESHPKSKETRDTLFAIWESLKKRADFNKDNTVSADEWCQMWATGGTNDWQHRYKEFMFDLEDTSAPSPRASPKEYLFCNDRKPETPSDGQIDEEEFVKVFKNFNLDEDDVRNAYQKFSQNNSVTITKDVFDKLWDEYFSADDPNAQGNFIFGKANFD